MKIQALGCGCKKSVQNYEAILEAAKELDLADSVEFYKDMEGILEMGVMSTPALVIENKVYSTGRALNKKQALELIKKALENKQK